jgi:hypothetical protein
MLPDVSPHDWAQALDRLVEETLAQAGVLAPPVDAFAVAAALGMEVATNAAQQERARYVRLRGGAGRGPVPSTASATATSATVTSGRPAILLRPEPRCERRQWAVAHEIGEHLAHRLLTAVGADIRLATGAREWGANRFASRLLLPGCWFAAAGAACDWELPRLKERFATASHELLSRRMLEEPAPVIVTICDRGRITFRAGNGPGRAPPLNEAERACLARAQLGNASRARGPAGSLVRGWPVHEPGWQREILRADLPDEIADDWESFAIDSQ